MNAGATPHRDEPVPPPAVVLLSGGLDSATCLAIARAEGHAASALTVRYGQRHDAEIAAAERVARAQGCNDHRVIEIDLGAFGGSALTDSAIDVPKSAGALRGSPPDAGIPVTYVPARNTIFLAYALGLAEVLDARRIYIGVNAVDYSGYPDCRPAFIEAFASLSRVATRAGLEGRAPEICTPLIGLTKPDIIRRGLDLGVDFGLTHSCYDPAPGGRACGRCDACRIRRAAFDEVGVPDPALA